MSNGQYEVVVQRNVMVAMRDGVELATDLYFPARGGQALAGSLPVLLLRTPYNKDEVEATLGANHWFAERGYLCVIQDCRGCYQSGGDVNFLFPEAEDGFDTLAWIDQQAWSNGRVGSWGTSWMGVDPDCDGGVGPQKPGGDGAQHERFRRTSIKCAARWGDGASLSGLGILALGDQHPEYFENRALGRRCVKSGSDPVS